MALGGVGSCNGVSVGGVGNNCGSSSSHSTSTGVGDGRTTDPVCGEGKSSRSFSFFSFG